ncbi:MAG: adenylate/guanylate cyclase domain-containing protein [Candidatus Riflebacteria bacterium]|nr:adenylate/guanylate cyclase domain-containing protein [Candidatus Riflebacteria bacterium]
MKKVFLLAIFILILVIFLPFKDDLENWSIDQRFLFRGTHRPLENMVIIGIDGPTMAWAKRPFFTFLPLFGELIDALGTASTSSVFFDISYDTIPDEVIRNHVSETFQKLNSTIEPRLLKSLGFALPFRQALIKSLSTGLKVILGFAYQTGRELKIEKSLLSILPESQIGFLNVEPDRDHVIRRYNLFATSPDSEKLVPSVDLAISAQFLKSSNTSEKMIDFNPSTGLSLAGKKIAGLFEHRSGLINYAGPQGTYPMISLKESLLMFRNQPENFRSFFSGKTVLVGIWLIEDIKMIPGFGYIPGVEIHANVVENILRNNFLTPPFPSEKNLILFLAFLLFLPVSYFFKLEFRAVFFLALSIVWTLLSFFLFKKSILVTWSNPFCFFLLAGVINSLLKWYETHKEKSRIRSLFGKYVSEKALEALLELPFEKFGIGEKREVGIMFLDIRSFTSFSETREPEEVVDFLNRFFQVVTEIIYLNGGMVDKYLGDGMMVLFNVPFSEKNFISAMVNTALSIRKEIGTFSQLNPKWNFSLKVGIAINSGIGIVGNIGTEKRLEYTVIGDVVNVTSRIEPLNKEYGTDILATEAVISPTSEEFIWEFVEEKILRGKEKPVKLFKLIEKK